MQQELFPVLSDNAKECVVQAINDLYLWRNKETTLHIITAIDLYFHQLKNLLEQDLNITNNNS